MTKAVHTVYVASMILIIAVTTIYLIYSGYAYYSLALEERFYHTKHNWFKPSGSFGHGLGILGTCMILFGVSIYIARKRYNFLSKLIRLKYLLEFHIFLCTLGPILILFHTAFKFGGIVSIAFWSMVAVVLSGVIGRFIYIQIPRTIEGRELNLVELHQTKNELSDALRTGFTQDNNLINKIIETSNEMNDRRDKKSYLQKYLLDRKLVKSINKKLKSEKISRRERKKVTSIIKSEMALSNKIERLQTMQKLFKYWHVAHLPFALIMLIIVVLHVGITLAFGYKWIF